MAKYERTWKHNGGAGPNAHWQWAHGSDVISSYVGRQDYHGNNPGIEQKLARIIEAMGLIADASGINLLDVFDKHDLEDVFRLNQNPEA